MREYSTMTFPATHLSCLFYCLSAPKIELKSVFDLQLESREKPKK